MAADLRPSLQHYLNSLLQAQTFPTSHIDNAATRRPALQLPTDTPQTWHADSASEIKTAPGGGKVGGGEGREKKNKNPDPHSFSIQVRASLSQ